MAVANDQNDNVNAHIREYLNYYCDLSYSPGFAVLLKGKWGCRKTWFIKQYCNQLKKTKKILYVSLYGVTSFSEIEDAFLQELYPVSSKGIKVAGKILSSLIKSTIKIDMGKETLSYQLPSGNISSSIVDLDKSILIFDDLERCQIDLENLLGYINSFVEHQDLKVIIIANESEIQNTDYSLFKEKVIGKNFKITCDVDNSINSFIERINDAICKTFLFERKDFVKEIFQMVEYENLRVLGQTLLDFERIFRTLNEKEKGKSEMTEELLKILMLFSFEIRCGKILPESLESIIDAYAQRSLEKTNNQSFPENES